jgi:hypothetical protein
VSLIVIRDKALQIALGEVGVRERGGNNRGPDVEKYLAAVGLGGGYAWCAAFVVWCYREATLRTAGGLSLPLRRTGKVVRLWQHARDLWMSDRPSVGAVYIHLESPDDPDSDGHCGIVTSFTDRAMSAVEGNTNAAGSRLGNQVRVQLRPLSYVNAGFIDVGREGPVDLGPVA